MKIAIHPVSRGHELEMGEDKFGFLEENSRADPPGQLRDLIGRQGYIFVREMFAAEEVLSVRAEICDAMFRQGLLAPETDLIDCIPHPEVKGIGSSKGSSTVDGMEQLCPAMTELLYGQSTRAFFESLLGGAVRHYDLTWFRGVPPGFGTVPHCDIVYMGRGTHDLLTMWVPYGSVAIEAGGLMILEDSMKPNVQKRIRKYLQRDVDEYCENRPLPEHVDLESKEDNKVWNGWLASNPVTLRNNLGGRWLAAEYRPGDALIFACKLVHGSLDNQSNAFRLSTDCRYQLANQPVDQRFVGSGPLGHVGSAKRGRIC